MKLLITGATGFVGRHLCSHLLREGAEIHAVVRPTTDQNKLADSSISCVVDDGSTQTLIEYFKNHGFDSVLHLAAFFVAEHQSNQIQELIESNVLFGTRLLEAAVAAAIPRFISTGTTWQHYHSQDYLPANLYAASKQAFADLARYYCEVSSVHFTTLLLSDTFGPGDERPKLLNRWNQISHSGEIMELTPGDQHLDLLHVDDVVEAYLCLLKMVASDRERQYTGSQFAVHAEQQVTLKELADLFVRATGRKLSLRWGVKPYRRREVMVPWNGGKPIPGWKNRISLEEGLRRTYGGDNISDE